MQPGSWSEQAPRGVPVLRVALGSQAPPGSLTADPRVQQPSPANKPGVSKGSLRMETLTAALQDNSPGFGVVGFIL